MLVHPATHLDLRFGTAGLRVFPLTTARGRQPLQALHVDAIGQNILSRVLV